MIDNIYDEDEVIHQAITFMIGGFHTSGNYMTWFFYYLALYPDIQARVRAEIADQLGDGGLTNLGDMDRLGYTRQVMDETLRHTKLASFSERKAETDMEIGGFLIPAGSQIVNALCLALDEEEYFPNPRQFDPNNCSKENVKNLAFSPFGFGVRKCPGYRFANLEMVVAAVEILNRFKIEVCEGEPKVRPQYGFVTKPDKQVWVKLA